MDSHLDILKEDGIRGWKTDKGLSLKCMILEPGVVVHAYNSSTWEAEGRGYLKIKAN
jgi:hypothetical protein